MSLAPTPFIYLAEFIRYALVIAVLGGVRLWFMKHCRSSANEPELPGVEWLVPDEVVKNCWLIGKNMPEARPQTPPPSKQEIALPVVLGKGGGLFWATPPVMCVPGAEMSGFLRPSVQGPRLEKLMMSFALSAPLSAMPQPSFPAAESPPAAVACD